MKRKNMYWLPVSVLVMAFVASFIGCPGEEPTTADTREFALSIDPGIADKGTITTNPAPGMIRVGTQITVTTVQALDGYRLRAGSLKYNSTAITGSSRRFNMPAADAVVSAIFDDYTYTGPTENPGQPDIDKLGDWDAQLDAWTAELIPIIEQMTLEQKVGQMTQGLMDQMSSSQGASSTFETVPTYFVGSILAGGHSQPNQSVFNNAFGTDASPQSWRNLLNTMVDKSMEATYRNGAKIPLIFGLDCMHGASKIQNATMLPHNIGLGAIAVGDADKGILAAYDAAQLTSREMLAGGLRWTFGPVLGVAESNGWGRMYESYSERAEIVDYFGKYFTRGLHLAGVATCPKHFGPEGQMENGGNSNANANITLEEYKSGRSDAPAHLQQRYISPYEEAIKERTMSIMMCYNSRNRTRIHEDKELMMDLLKGEMGFRGMILTDWNSLASVGPANATYRQQVTLGINAGIDMVMAAGGNWLTTINALKDEVNAGNIPIERINDAVLRCLLFKKSVGHQGNLTGGVCQVSGCNVPNCNGEQNFWNHPNMRDTVVTAEVLRTPANIELAANLVADSLVLLKNENEVIQNLYNGVYSNVLLTGSASANIGLQNGGWTIEWAGSTSATATAGVNIEQGIRALLTEQGRAITLTRTAGSAANSDPFDVVIAVVAEDPYAESQQLTGNITWRDADANVLRYAYDVKNSAGEAAPVIVIVISGRPMNLVENFDRPDAIIAAWLPGTEAGTGIAEMLFTDREYVGKTAYTWHRTRKNAPWEDGVTYPFGHGLRKNKEACTCAAYVNPDLSGCWLDQQ